MSVNVIFVTAFFLVPLHQIQIKRMSKTKKIAFLLLFVSILPTFSFAGEPDPTDELARPANLEAFDEANSEFEALFNVTGDQIIDKARQYLGRPYRRGSMGPSSFDCSGFTSYVYKSLNIRLGRSSRDQWREGLSVERNDVHVGDLVFFGSSQRIGHVGIVCEVEGDGGFKFIHASCSNGITISDIDEHYYSRLYRGLRRIIE